MNEGPTREAVQVDVYWVPLDTSKSSLTAAEAVLSPDEHERLARMLPNVRAGRVIARAALRRLLSEQLGISPADVTFAYDACGKPRLGASHVSNLTFTLSHSGEWVAVAVSESCRLGLDIEQTDPSIEYDLIASRIMSRHELSNIKKLSKDNGIEAVFRAWVMKEAFAKAVGLGLTLDMPSVEVITEHGWGGSPWKPPPSWGHRQWSMFHIDAPGNFVAAMAIESIDIEIRAQEFNVGASRAVTQEDRRNSCAA